MATDLQALQANELLPQHTAVLIFLHGADDNCHRWKRLFRDSRLSSLHRLCIVVPQAAKRDIIRTPSVASTGVLRSWRSAVYVFDPETKRCTCCFSVRREVQSQVEYLCDVVEKYSKLTSNVFLGGFSQGGTMATLGALNVKARLAGFVLLGPPPFIATRKRFVDSFDQLNLEYLSNNPIEVTSQPMLPNYASHKFGHSANVDVPIFMAIGEVDDLQDGEERRQTEEYIATMFRRRITFKVYDGLAHTANREELNDVADFIANICPSVIDARL